MYIPLREKIVCKYYLLVMISIKRRYITRTIACRYFTVLWYLYSIRINSNYTNPSIGENVRRANVFKLQKRIGPSDEKFQLEVNENKYDVS